MKAIKLWHNFCSSDLFHIILGHKSNLKNILLGLHGRTELWKWRSSSCLMLLDRCFSVFCALKFSPVQKGAHSVHATPFQMSVIFPFISFSFSSSVFYNQLAWFYYDNHLSLNVPLSFTSLYLSLSIPTVCSLGCLDRCISFYTNLSALTVAVATHHCHGNPDGLGGGGVDRGRQSRTERKEIWKRETDREWRKSPVFSH